MPSDSVATFLDKARASHALDSHQIDQLATQPDAPQADLGALCEYLEGRRVLTRFQADMIRDGKGADLHFAGYPVRDELGPCPGGTAYRAAHPALRTPVVLRRLRADWLAPADDPAAFLQRARAASALPHPNLVPLLDAGFHGDELYAALDAPADAATLDALVKDIGPMPAFLAAEYARQALAGLRAAHERGLVHGDVRPATLVVGPLAASNKTGPDGKPKLRPAPTATVRVAELGLVPVRPPAAQAAPDGAAPDPAALPYLPPERVDAAAYTPAGDLYGLGASLFYLLTGRPPFAGSSPADVLAKVRSADPPPLEAVRPDLPAPLVALVTQLLAKAPHARPATAAEVDARLAPFVRSAPAAPPVALVVPAAAAPAAYHATAVPHHGDDGDVAMTAPAAPVAPGEDEWMAEGGGSFTGGAAAAPRAPRVTTAEDKKKTRKLIILGILVWGVGIGGWVVYGIQKGWFGSEPEKPAVEKPKPTPKPPGNKPKTPGAA